jgi:hypothetical protein
MSSVHDCAFPIRRFHSTSFFDLALRTLSNISCDGAPKICSADVKSNRASPRRSVAFIVDEYFSSIEIFLPNTMSALPSLNRKPVDEPLYVGVDRRVRSQVLKCKNSPAGPSHRAAFSNQTKELIGDELSPRLCSSQSGSPI